MREVIQGPVFEVGLFPVLHLDYDPLAFVGLAMDVKDDFPTLLCLGQSLIVHDSQVLDRMLPFEEVVQELN